MARRAETTSPSLAPTARVGRERQEIKVGTENNCSCMRKWLQGQGHSSCSGTGSKTQGGERVQIYPEMVDQRSCLAGKEAAKSFPGDCPKGKSTLAIRLGWEKD